MRSSLHAYCLVGCAFAALAGAPAPAQEIAAAAPDIAPTVAAQVTMQRPHVSPVAADWGAVRAALADIAPLGTAAHPLARLNAATQRFFPDIGASPVPVLLPFDTATFLVDDAAASGAALDRSKYMQGYSVANFFFLAGPSGYDASLTLQPGGKPGAAIDWRRRLDVQISASTVIYELGGPVLPQGSPVPELNDRFPGIRRLTLEEHLRYTFVRFGVPYAVTIMCFRARCRDEEKIGTAFLKALNIVGGAPQAEPAEAAKTEPTSAPQHVARPTEISPDFTFYPPGNILPGTGLHGAPGRTDTTVFADIRFPLAQAPAYVNSQTFGNWGDCDFTGRVALGGEGKGTTYRCKVNFIPLVRDEAKNYAYPWRDNFCEHRYFAVSQCPAGLGHQGEDIRPASCKERDAQAERCEPYQADIVAVRDGTVLRGPGDEGLYLVVNVPGEHIRFRYLHMNPALMDEAGMISGRALKEGETIGTVDDYDNYQGGTTYHLHFDVQVPTRDGWVFVNPYMTLVASYEQLIGARGTAIDDSSVAAMPNTGATGLAAAEAGEGKIRRHAARPTGHLVSHNGALARHHRRDQRARHARRAGRHGRA